MTRSILFIVLLILLSAFFSGSEISYAGASEVKLRKAAENAAKKRSREKYANDIKENYEEALISILIGNNLVNIASSAVATVIAVGLMGDAGAGVATLIMTVIIIILARSPRRSWRRGNRRASRSPRPCPCTGSRWSRNRSSGCSPRS